MDWKLLLASAPGIVALLGQAWAWLLRRQDARWLERMKGEVRREVEEDLKTHESRLRVEGELRLRVHDRAWHLLRDLIGASWDLHQAVLDYAIRAAHPTSDSRRLSEPYELANKAMMKLSMLAATAPPEHAVNRAVAKFRDSFNSANELAIPAEPPEEPRTRLMTIRRGLDDGLGAMHDVCANWNETLWEATTVALATPGGSASSGLQAPNDERSGQAPSAAGPLPVAR